LTPVIPTTRSIGAGRDFHRRQSRPDQPDAGRKSLGAGAHRRSKGRHGCL
jgi:hypothetical protein